MQRFFSKFSENYSILGLCLEEHHWQGNIIEKNINSKVIEGFYLIKL